MILVLLGAMGWILFEIASVWLIMPMPGSQRLTTVELAYFLHAWRWAFRALFAGFMLMGMGPALAGRWWHKVLAVLLVVAAGAVTYFTSFVMQADRIFVPPRTLVMAPAAGSTVDPARLVVGVVLNGEPRAYPIQFVGYHHQIRDVVGGVPVLVTYCTVCRTGRVYSPMVGDRLETFRLVGMDRWNAMFEDKTTKSWWRQVSGEAIVGPLKGKRLAELPSTQVSLDRWLALHPDSRVMQADTSVANRYTTNFDFESGASRGALTGTDTGSWRDKSWVVGIDVDGAAKAYDWNRLKRERVVNDAVGGVPVVLVLAADDKSFFAFRRPDAGVQFVLAGDSLTGGVNRYSLAGSGPAGALGPVQASQEFWHSWRTFHPTTERY